MAPALPRIDATRIPAVESLRGLAALYVLAYHLLHVPTEKVHAPDFAAGFLSLGNGGVTLFFVISAFTLCLSSENRSNEARPLLRFYIRRVFRIVPLFLVLLVVTIARSWYLYRVVPSPLSVGANLTFLYNFIPGHQQGIVWASWTLGVEMVFYAFFPLIFKSITTLSRGLAFFGVACAGGVLLCAMVGNGEHFFYYSIFRHLPAFAAGMVMFHLYKRSSDVAAWIPIGLVAAGCLGHWFLWTHPAIEHGQFVPLQSVVWVSLALGLCLSPLWVFVNRGTRFLGEISYSSYLVHPLVLIWMTPLIPMMSGNFAASLAVAFFGVTAIACCTYRWIEQPGIRFGSRLIKRYCVVNARTSQPLPVGAGSTQLSGPQADALSV